MNIKIQSIHFDADKKLLDLITKKLEKLEQFSGKIIDANVYLKLNNHKDKANKQVEIKLNTSLGSIFTEYVSDKFETATDKVVETLKMQIVKRKEQHL
ncbi:MAG: ribosome-associated translation inhibitor RaiA [Bacteroidetes bacterium]|nr:ribosome-associated translation inhibitor RaiA [Bacteroidota bacterium]